MKWVKRGLVYCPPGDQAWAKSYATIPTAHVIDSHRVRIYFASVDAAMRGRIGFVDIDPRKPQRILMRSEKPVLDLGEPGTFDDSGVNPSCVIQRGEHTLLYYIGWQRCERVPYMLFAGLAKMNSDGAFDRVQQTPILDRTPSEPFLRSATTIVVEDVMRVWYVSADRWTMVGARQYPRYRIRYAESDDGVSWKSVGDFAIDFQNEDEFGFGRPWVLKDSNIYRMWYSIRSRTAPYRIGYAESSDGTTWTRRDSKAGLDVSSEGWDSEIVCYPCVVDVGGERYMFYNGNRHGATGFGCAILE